MGVRVLIGCFTYPVFPAATTLSLVLMPPRVWSVPRSPPFSHGMTGGPNWRKEEGGRRK